MADRPENTIVGHIKNGFLSRMMNHSPPTVTVWLALANRADKSGHSWPSVDSLQEDTGLSRCTVCKALQELRDSGEIFVVHGGGRYGSKKYRFRTSSDSKLVQSARLTSSFCAPTSSDSELADNIPNQTRTKQRTKRVRAKRFCPPSVDDVRAYCTERKNGVDAQAFIDHYESNGWKVGRSAMKDWRAAVRTWERNGLSPSRKASSNYAAGPGQVFDPSTDENYNVREGF